MMTASVLTASSLVEPGSATSVVLFVLVTLAVVGAVVTIIVRTRRQQHGDQPGPGDDDRGPGEGTAGD
ncbi:hypothetical protein ACH9EU_04265 [Kocuria sp. M1R5S2]|uniref:hypothetical protein n=1 Tax=Kocuria rhizosphaerae TaxID=3376285 RepID=UPI003796D8A7